MMGFLITLVLLYVIYSINGAIIEVKNASLKNKSIFIEEFKRLGYDNHQYTKANYNAIKSRVESNYPQIDYVKSQDLKYASVMFRNGRNSVEYKKALKGKEDISKIYREIEYDALAECFMEIVKVDGIDNEKNSINDEFMSKNTKLFKSISNNIFFSKKIVKMIKFLFLVIFVFLFNVGISIFPIIKMKLT